MSIVEYDGAVVAEVASYLDLRAPNAAALDRIARALEEREPGAEIVADLATGVGKTYIAGGLLDYLWEQGVRNIVIITPGSTIQRKTIANLTPGNRKYLNGLKCDPQVITLDDLERGTVAHALDNPDQLKVVVMTVQSLLRPNTKDNRRAYQEHETLGISLSDYLKGVDDLVVIADEHHVYFNRTARQFRKAIEGLHPAALIGLTATPHESTDAANIVYQYPLAEAIADGFVKIPVLVARQDRKADLRTQMADGVALLHVKEQTMRAYADQTARAYVQPVMFVVASSIDEANQIAEMLAGPDHLGSPDSVLLVTSEEPDTVTGQLDELEHPNSPIRAVVSVQMLGIGWDVKNVYIVAAVRALESELLTEQILGRGLRLPFGKRTGIPMLDTVEVLSHHAFAELLKQAKILLAQTLGQRADDAEATTSVTPGVRGDQVNLDQPGTTPAVSDPNTTISVTLPGPAGAADDTNGTLFNTDVTPTENSDGTPTEHEVVSLSTVDARLTQGQAAAATVETPLTPRTPNGTHLPLYLPKVTYKTVRPVFSLTSIDLNAVEARGAMFANDNAPTLQRKLVNAHREDDGVEVTISDAKESVTATSPTLPFTNITNDLISRLLRTNACPQTATELNAATHIARAFLKGAQVTEETPWREEHGRLATESLATYISQKESEQPVTIQPEVELVRWPEPPQVTQKQPPADRQQITHSSDFQPHYPYSGWDKSFYPAVTFDSYTGEFRLAERLEASPNIKAWQRITWNVPLTITYRFNDGNKTYIPDFIVVEDDGTPEGRYWIVEGKANRDLLDPAVNAKRDAAKRWIDAVNASTDVPTKWGYLLASESVIAHAHDWNGLKAAGQTHQ